MPQNNSMYSSANGNPGTDQLDLLGFVEAIVSNRWMIIRNLIATVILVTLVSFVLPRKYTATAVLMPPQDKDRSYMENVLAEVSMPGLSLPSSSSSSSEIMVEILKSRSVNERVLKQFFKTKRDSLPLYKILGTRSVDLGLIKISKKVSFSSSKQGMITINAEMKNKNLAADVANAYVEALDKINNEKNVSKAKNSRIYIEAQLKETEQRLREVNQKLAQFQQQHKAVSLEEQMKSAIEQAGEVKGQIIAKQVQLGVMLQAMKAENPLVIRVQQELSQLQQQYKTLQYGNGLEQKPDSEFYLPFAQVPEVGLQLAELMREEKVQETVWELLNQQYYQAKIQEARDTPTVQALDQAVPPVYPSWPKKKLLVAVCGMLSIIFSIFWIFCQKYLAKLDANPKEKERLVRIAQELGGDIKRIKRLGK
jgi:tyrosine-protein kinase Etk/Wzc